ncbi:MAG: hypothetical protein OJF51_004500 [Nitrospira sp.]|nr:MAG: hypothetical protein OJF51_004500 [Nitrospira sp.]
MAKRFRWIDVVPWERLQGSWPTSQPFILDAGVRLDPTEDSSIVFR